MMRLLSEETSKWVHRCVDLVTAGKTIRENMLEHVTEQCHAPPFGLWHPSCPQAASVIFSGRKITPINPMPLSPAQAGSFEATWNGISLNKHSTTHIHTVFSGLINVRGLWDSVNLAVLTVSFLFQFQNKRVLKIILTVKENRQVSLLGLKCNLDSNFSLLLLAFRWLRYSLSLK